MAKRDYPDNGYPSVTGVIGQIPSFSLIHWFKKTPYNEILETSKRGKEIGTQMHNCLQDFCETGKAKIDTEYPEEITFALQSFQLFRKENPNLVLKKAEIKMSSDKYGVNGTTDILIEKSGVLCLGDYKSSKVKDDEEKPPIFDEAKTQASAYVKMSNDVMNASIEEAVIISLAKNKIAYNYYELSKEEIDSEFNEVFLPLLKVWKYKNVTKKGE
jgi:hypothetical protein